MRFYQASLFLFPRNYHLRIFAICFVGTHLPLISFIVWEWMAGPFQWKPTLILLAATLLGTGGALLALQWLLHPIVVATNALGELESRRPVTPLPPGGADLVGRLLARVNSAAKSTSSLIETLDDAAHRDLLTGLNNRRGFLERASIMIERHRRIAVAMIDLDRFKQLNDQFGHPAGDQTLHDFAALLQSGLRKNDLVARWGGEEFAVFFPDQSEQDALRILERVRRKMAEAPLAVIDRKPLSFSAGISSIQPKDSSTEAALARADKALYVAKDQGRDRIVLAD